MIVLLIIWMHHIWMELGITELNLHAGEALLQTVTEELTSVRASQHGTGSQGSTYPQRLLYLWSRAQHQQSALLHPVLKPPS